MLVNELMPVLVKIPLSIIGLAVLWRIYREYRRRQEDASRSADHVGDLLIRWLLGSGCVFVSLLLIMVVAHSLGLSGWLGYVLGVVLFLDLLVLLASALAVGWHCGDSFLL